MALTVHLPHVDAARHQTEQARRATAKETRRSERALRRAIKAFINGK